MTWIKAVVREVVGLFVDDVWFAVAILVWVGLVAGLLPKALPNTGWGGVALFGGLAIILIGSAVRFARKAGRRR